MSNSTHIMSYGPDGPKGQDQQGYTAGATGACGDTGATGPAGGIGSTGHTGFGFGFSGQPHISDPNGDVAYMNYRHPNNPFIVGK